MHTILVITGNGTGAAGETANAVVVAVSARTLLAIRLCIDAGADAQSGHDAMCGAVVGKLRLVVAGSNAGAGVGQVTEIVAAEGDNIILDLTIGFRTRGRA